MKICINCNLELELTDFHRCSSFKDGYRSTCKTCRKQTTKEYYDTNVDKLREKSAKYRREHPEKAKEAVKVWCDNNKEYLLEVSRNYYLANKDEISQESKLKHRSDPKREMINAARRRAKIKQVPFDITTDDILIPEFCPILKLRLMVNSGKPKENSPSLDRIVSELGYVKGNIMVISHLANTMKNKASFEQLVNFAKFILENYK